MALPDLKEFALPESETELAALLDAYGDNALIVAGGTFLHGLEARGFLSGTEALIDLRNLGLDQIAAEKGGTRVGASVTFSALARLPVLERHAYGALRDALACPPAQIMNLATVGGCIAASCPFFDVPAALQVLDSQVFVAGGSSDRQQPISAMYCGMFDNTLATGEYISSLFLPEQGSRTASAYLKLETNANDLALVGVAVRITLGIMGKISDSRVLLGGGLNDTFVRSEAAEEILNGAKPQDEVFEQAAEAIVGCIDPISDHRCSSRYRTAIGKVYVKRALRLALQRHKGESS